MKRNLSVALILCSVTAAASGYVVDYEGILLRHAKWGYIDTAGRVVIEAKFDQAAPFSKGRAAVRVGEKWDYIDVAEFSEGLAAFATGADHTALKQAMDAERGVGEDKPGL